MSLDRIIGIVGLLISLPGFFLLFMKDHETVGAITVLLGLILLGAAFYHRYWTNIPPYTVLRGELTLTILDAEGAAANVSNKRTIRPNFKHLTTMVHKNISADGAIDDLRLDGKPLPPSAIKRELGELQIGLSFEPPLERFKPFETHLEYSVKDSFPEPKEALLWTCDFPTKVALITVRLPKNRPCKKAEASRMRGSGESPLGKLPFISENRCTISIELKRPTFGERYALYWDW